MSITLFNEVEAAPSERPRTPGRIKLYDETTGPGTPESTVSAPAAPAETVSPGPTTIRERARAAAAGTEDLVPEVGALPGTELERAARPATMTMGRSGTPIVTPSSEAMPERPQNMPPWSEVIKSFPAQMALGYNKTKAALAEMFARNNVLEREALMHNPNSAWPEGTAVPRIVQRAREANVAKLAADRANLGEAIVKGRIADTEEKLVTPENMGPFQQAVTSFGQSMVPSSAALAVAGITRNPQAAALFAGTGAVQQGASTYREAYKRLTEEQQLEQREAHRRAGVAATMDTIIELSDMVPVSVALRPGTPAYRKLAQTVGTEFGTEMGQQVMQDWRSKLMENPGLTWKEVADNALVAGVAGALGGGVHGGTGIALDRARGPSPDTAAGRAAIVARELEQAARFADLSADVAPQQTARETTLNVAPQRDLAAEARAAIEEPGRQAAAERQLVEDAANAAGPENRYDTEIAQHVARLVTPARTPLPAVDLSGVANADEAAALRRGAPPFVADREPALDELGQALTGSATRGQTLEQSRLTRTLNREQDVGAPANERTMLIGQNGEKMVVGRLSRRDWLTRAERNLPGKELGDARGWYTQIHDVLEPIFKERTPNVLRAWLLSQQRARPSQGMMNVFRALDRMRGLPGKQAGLNEKALIAALRGIEGDEGMGAKLADFIDSALGEGSRRVMGRAESGGQPAAIDVHSYRDTGFVDAAMMNHIRRIFGEKQAAKLKEDLSLGKEPSYEYGVAFYNNLTKWLNEHNVDGGGWTAPQAQAVGWMAMQKQLGLEPETAKDIISKNTRRVSLGLSTEAGAPFSAQEARGKIADLAKLTGVNILRAEHGTGAYLGETEQAFQLDVIASPEAVRDFMDALGYAFQQSSVIATRALKTGKQHAIEIIGVPSGQENDFFQRMHAHSDLAAGFQPTDGGIKILNFASHWSERQLLQIMDAANEAASEMGVQLTDAVEYNVDLQESSNDWQKQPDGQAYLASLRDRGRLQQAETLAREHAPALDQLGEGVRRGRQDQSAGDSPASAVASVGQAVALAGTPQYKAAEEQATKIFANYEQAKRTYSELADSDGGRILNPDIASELVPTYVAQRELASAVHEEASAFVKKLYAERLAQRTPAGKMATVFFSSGGPGSGKSTALGRAMGGALGEAELYYDTSMSRYESARQKIDAALASGRSVAIAFVQRAPEAAYEHGVVSRVERGYRRVVPIAEHARAHVGSREVLLQLADHYKDDPRVAITAIDNTGSLEQIRIFPPNEVSRLEYNDVHAATLAAAQRAHQAGRLTEQQLHAAAGPRATRVAEEGGRGSRLESQEEAGQLGEGSRRGIDIPYGTRSTSPASVGMKSNISAVPEQLRRRLQTPLMEEQWAIAGALDDLQHAGLPRWMVESVSGWYSYKTGQSDNSMMFFPQSGAIGVRQDKLTMARNGHRQTLDEMRFYIGHELGHQLDSTGIEHQEMFTWENFSNTSPRLEFDVKGGFIVASGDLMDEAAHLFQNQLGPQGLRDLLTYPLAGISQYSPDTIKSETLAQIHGLYFTAPKTVKKWLPTWYSLFESVYGKEAQENQPQSLADARSRLQQALQGEGAGERTEGRRVRGEDRRGAGLGATGEGVAGRTGTSQLPPTGGTQPPAGNRRGTAAGHGPGAVNWNVDQPGVVDALTRAFQNQQVDLKAVMEAIREAGGIVAPATDPYLTEELAKSRYSARIKGFDEKHVKPLLKEMKAAGITAEDLGRYLWARHAPEANAKLAQLNPGLPDASGMSNAQAAQEMVNFRQAGQIGALQRLAARVDAMTKATRDLIVAEKLASKRTIQTWEQAYKHYVPLHREIENPSPGQGQGFKIQGPESKRRMGSQRPAVAILAAVIGKHHNAIIRAEKARVGRDLVKLVDQFPNEDFWRKDTPPTQRYINPSSGLVETRIDPQYRQREDVFIVKDVDANDNEIEHVVAFNPHNERALRLSRAMGKLDAVEIGAVTAIVGKASRFFANLATQWNPTFWATNLVRDVGTMAVNLQSTPLRGKAPRVMARMPIAMAGIADAVWHNGNSHYAQMWREFEAEGGPTGFYKNFENILERQKDLEKMIDQEGRSNADPRVWAKWAGAQISDLNAMIENSTRLAVYTMARDAGISKREAASIAKNITVNFDRRGNSSIAANAWYMFFNANMQGSARMIKGLATSPRAQAVAGMLTAMGAAMYIINLLIGDRDRDEAGNNPYELISDWEKQRNWIFMVPKEWGMGSPVEDAKKQVIGRYFKIALPYGFNIFPSFGRLAAEAAMSAAGSKAMATKRSALEMAGDFANVVIDAFSPLGQTATPLQTIAPTIADPFVQIWENKKFTGTALVPDRQAQQKQLPRSELYFNSNSEIAKDLASWLNRISGGNQLEPGAIDVYPGHIEHTFRTLTGGPGTFAMGMFDWAKNLTERGMGKPVESIKTSSIPFVGKFYGEVDERAIEAKFYDVKKKADEIYQRTRAMRKAGDVDGAERVRDENTALYDFAKAVSDRTFVRERRERANEMRGTRELPIVDREAAKREIRLEQTQLYQRALEAYNAAAREGR